VRSTPPIFAIVSDIDFGKVLKVNEPHVKYHKIEEITGNMLKENDLVNIRGIVTKVCWFC